MNRPPLSAIALTALLPALLAGCVGTPQLGPKPAPAPISSYAASQSLAPLTAAAAQWPAQDWWQAYNDPQLTALIEEALAGAPDVAVALARLHQAQGYQTQQRAALLPKVDGRVIAQETLGRKQ